MKDWWGACSIEVEWGERKVRFGATGVVAALALMILGYGVMAANTPPAISAQGSVSVEAVPVE